jgi:pimeloyl-ACP methyl ester carboxylesterase
MIYPRAYWLKGDGDIPNRGYAKAEMRYGGTATTGLTAWISKDAPTLIAVHGNATDAVTMSYSLEAWRRAGWNVVLPEYPGYGADGLDPDERNMTDSVKASWEWAKARGATPSRTVLLANSIGTGPALAASTTIEPEVIAIVSGFTDFIHVIQHHVAVPEIALRDRWEETDILKSTRSRILVWHGRKDTVIPFTMGKKVAAAAGTGLTALPGGHEIFWNGGLQDDVLRQVTEVMAEESPR